MKTNTYLASKPRYEILDGLRGVAAMIVVAFHLFETYSAGIPYQILNHGYLAVDFFFVLSGFVIGYAYDDRWDRMSIGGFFKRRLVRLHPMLIMGTFIGLLFFLMGGDHPDFAVINQTPWWLILLLCLWGFTMIPIPASLDIRGWSEVNPLNGATWSLMWEYVANILYALFIRHLSKTMLTIFVAFSAFLTVTLCLDIDIFGVLKERSYAAYTVVGGWSLSSDQLLVGISRLLYPFFTGLLISRLGKSINVKGGFWWCSLIVATLLVMPRIGGSDPANFWMNGLYEAVCILIAFPIVVAMGAGSKVSGRKSTAVCKFLGEISYPLYVTHYPLIYVQMSWAATHKDLPQSLHILFAISIFILAVMIAYGSLKAFDEPVREWLKQKLLVKKGVGK